MIDAIIFDLDDTLVVDKDVVVTALMTACVTAGDRADPNALLRAIWAAAYDRWESVPAGQACARCGIAPLDCLLSGSISPQYQIDTWLSALASSGLDDVGLAREMHDCFRREAYRGYRLYGDVASALDALADRVKLGIVTNGAVDLQRYKLKRTRIADRFQAAAISSGIGSAKPSAEIFEAACVMLGVDVQRALMVGDSAEMDIAGAQGAGLRAVLLDRAGTRQGCDTIASLADVPALALG